MNGTVCVAMFHLLPMSAYYETRPRCYSPRQPLYLAESFQQASEQLGERPAFIEQVERAAFAVDGAEVVDAHGVIDGVGDVLGADDIVERVFRSAIAGAVDLAAADAAAGQ